jgi:hypothetical protein
LTSFELANRDEVEFVKDSFGSRRNTAALVRWFTGTAWLLAAASAILHVIHMRVADRYGAAYPAVFLDRKKKDTILTGALSLFCPHLMSVRPVMREVHENRLPTLPEDSLSDRSWLKIVKGSW